jgi:hypothetical protein
MIVVFVMKALLSFVEISNVTEMGQTTVTCWEKAARQGSVYRGGNGYRVEW